MGWQDIRDVCAEIGADPMKVTTKELWDHYRTDFVVKVGKHRFIKFIKA